MISAHTYKLLVASKLRGIGRKTLHALSADKLFYQAGVTDLAPTLAEIAGDRANTSTLDAAFRAADADVAAAKSREHEILGITDPQYPKLLREIDDRPAILFIAGRVQCLRDKAIAIVGTREPSNAGVTTAERITNYFASKSWQVVSGLAIGIDTVAHRIALQFEASTVAVVAHGLDKIYPKENEGLAREIVEKGGLVVSEYPYGTAAFPSHFVERDRVQAALALAVVMVQSDETGGSWHASRAALRYDRYLIVPKATEGDLREGHPKIRGNEHLFRASAVERAQFLKCDAQTLDKLILLTSRTEYPRVESTILGHADTQSTAVL